MATIKHGAEVWQLYVRRGTRVAYIEWKLQAVGGVPHKAAYWFSWERKKERLYNGRTDDVELLQTGRPALYEIVLALVKERLMEHGDPRLASPDTSTYSVTPAPPASPLGNAGVEPFAPLSTATPAPPAGPLIQKGAAAGLGAGDGFAPSTSGDPDGDLL
jgi:hypothetical protein